MDITPAIPAGRQIVESYGQRRFRVSGTLYDGSVLVFPDRTQPWAVSRMGELTLNSLDPVIDAAGELELLLIGCGPRTARVPIELRQGLRARGLVVEPMATGAACRTYNVLVSEERPIAAALIAVD